MRFVPVTSTEQQAALALHRTRDLLVKQRTQLVNMICGLLAESGSRWRGARVMRLNWRPGSGRETRPRCPPGPARGDRAGRSDRSLAASAHPTEEGVVGLASEQRPVAAPGNDSGCRHRLGNRAGRLGERARALPLRSAVRGLVARARRCAIGCVRPNTTGASRPA